MRGGPERDLSWRRRVWINRLSKSGHRLAGISESPHRRIPEARCQGKRGGSEGEACVSCLPGSQVIQVPAWRKTERRADAAVEVDGVVEPFLVTAAAVFGEHDLDAAGPTASLE